MSAPRSCITSARGSANLRNRAGELHSPKGRKVSMKYPVISSLLRSIGHVEPRSSQSLLWTKLWWKASDKSSLLISTPVSTSFTRKIAVSIVWYWQENSSFGIPSFMEWLAGHDKVVNYAPLGIECFWGISAHQRSDKVFERRHIRKGPIFCFSAISRSNLWVTASGLEIAERSLSKICFRCWPWKPICTPWVMSRSSSSARVQSGWSIK